MMLAIEDLPVDADTVSEYRMFHLKHGWSTESIHALVLNDVAIQRPFPQAHGDLNIGLLSADEFTAIINKAITDRNSLRKLLDAGQDLTPEQKERSDNEFQGILLNQIHEYIRAGKQALDANGVKYDVAPGVGLVVSN